MAIGFRELVAAAEREIASISVEEASGQLGRPGVKFVDVRDVRELWREGKIPGADHVPRGMLEFWLDPDSPYYRGDIFGEGERFILYCNKGWRSALAAQSAQAMGLAGVCHITGGFQAWADQGGPIEAVEKR